MCFKYLFKSEIKLKKESPKKNYKKIICNTCDNSCYTNNLYTNYQGVIGFCDKCWEDINNFKLDQA